MELRGLFGVVIVGSDSFNNYAGSDFRTPSAVV